ncbi:ABC transporter permease [Paenibacillus glucanolyticus]|jgi:ABC-2 type transport system permease protein|uniref:ABC transporter permease n=1 Tax=Paenibacillus TaxID=44249 RepID=UPI0003E229CA|nr:MULTISPECIES: ABC transporter permease [Paenibacillus]ANA79750.1 ABC transporter [Paenibacillus glucanolyticus]AVV56228.1 ABC transporter permease [Paenibacillus glucanolyticus]ETT38949.1 ABC-2 type transporter [Paenibacillus sp. FSL R5-808]MPY20105.1 ABC transporter permease [Paenibacillus glucanolyticus]
MHSLTIAWHMVRRTLGRKRGWIVYLLVPCVVVTLTVFLMGQTTAASILVSYVNEDEGPAGQYLISELERSGQYVLKQSVTESTLKEELIENKSTVGVYIPEGFSDALLEGQWSTVKVYEISTSEASVMIRMTADSAATRLSGTAALIRETSGPSVNPMMALEEVIGQSAQNRVDTQVTDLNLYARPGLSNVTGFTLMFMMTLISSVVSMIMDDRRQRTLSRIYTAPVRAYQIALGNFLGSLVVGSLQVVIVLVLSRYVLRYDYGIPLLLHFLILMAFMLVSLGVASTVAGLIRNGQNAAMINSMIVTPTCMLGGCFWPLAIMPDFMQKIANFIPQKWAIEAVETAATGGTLSDIGLPLAVLGLMAVILLAVGSVVLRPSESGAGHGA